MLLGVASSSLKKTTLGKLSLDQAGVGSYVSHRKSGPSNGNDASNYDTRMSSTSGTSCMFLTIAYFWAKFQANSVLFVASSSLEAIKRLHNKDPSQVSHQKFSKNKKNAHQELDGFSKSRGEGCLVSNDNHATNRELRAKGAEGL